MVTVAASVAAALPVFFSVVTAAITAITGNELLMLFVTIGLVGCAAGLISRFKRV